MLNIPKVSPIWVQEGNVHHKKESELFKRRTLARFHLENAKLSTNVTLSHPDFEFYGVCDVVIVGDDKVYPVEIKLHGEKPTKSQKMQLVAYGMVAEAIYGKKFDMGFVLFDKKGKTIPVKVTDSNKLEVRKIASEIIKMIEISKLPHSSADSAKCTQCEFLNYCNDRF